MLATAGPRDHELRVWILQAEEEQPKLLTNFATRGSAVTSAVFSKNEEHVIYGCDDNGLFLGDLSNGR